MRRSEKDQKSVIEGWIDERIEFMLSGLTQPFEKRIARLRERIEGLQDRVQRIYDLIEEDPERDPGGDEPPGNESS